MTIPTNAPRMVSETQPLRLINTDSINLQSPAFFSASSSSLDYSLTSWWHQGSEGSEIYNMIPSSLFSLDSLFSFYCNAASVNLPAHLGLRRLRMRDRSRLTLLALLTLPPCLKISLLAETSTTHTPTNPLPVTS